MASTKKARLPQRARHSGPCPELAGLRLQSLKSHLTPRARSQKIELPQRRFRVIVVRLIDFLDLSYGDVQRLSYKVARGLANSGVATGEKVAILSGNDALAFSCVFGISRAGAVWCPINPRNEATENRFVLDTFDCCFLFFHIAFAPMVERILPDLPKLRLAVCFDQELP